jgi:hypothetical protein
MALFRRRAPLPPSDLVVDGTNPLLVEWQAHADSADADLVSSLTATYAFAIPTDHALRTIAGHSPAGVVELGAGTGYWAALLYELGVDVVAFDRAPAGSADNKWFHSSAPWFSVQRGDVEVVDRYSDRTLLLVWPTRDETWAGDALVAFRLAGGDTVIHVGEGPGGRTGDARFHALLGDVGDCLACRYGILDVPCTCDIVPLWHKVDVVALPHWPGHHDDLHVYRRRPVVSPG